MKKRIMALAVVATMALATLLTGCGADAENTNGEANSDSPQTNQEEPAPTTSGDVIKVGVLQPITGGMAAGAAIEIEGIDLAYSERPTVTINGEEKQIELVKADNKSDKVESATAAQRLIEQDGVVAILGSYSSVPSIGAGEAIKNGEIPAIGLSCTNPLVTQDNPWYFRICFIDPYQGKVMANYAYNNLGATKAAVTREVSNDYSVGLAKYFVDEFIKLTGDENSVVTADYQTGDQDFSAQITNLTSANPDVFFVPGNFTECSMFIKQAKQFGVDVPILGGDTWEVDEFISVGGSEIEGVSFSAFFDADAELTPKTREFVTKYRESAGKDPAGCTALGYDGYNLLLDAIEAAGTTDNVALRDAIAAIDFEGVTGNVVFNENGDPNKSAVIKEVKDGKFVYKDTVSVE